MVSVVLSRCCASCQFVCFSKSRPHGKPCFAFFFPAGSQITDHIYRNLIHPTSFPKIKIGGRGNHVGFWHALPRHTRGNTCSSFWLKVNYIVLLFFLVLHRLYHLGRTCIKKEDWIFKTGPVGAE